MTFSSELSCFLPLHMNYMWLLPIGTSQFAKDVVCIDLQR